MKDQLWSTKGVAVTKLNVSVIQDCALISQFPNVSLAELQLLQTQMSAANAINVNAPQKRPAQQWLNQIYNLVKLLW